MLVNSADLCLKVMVLLKVLCYLDANEQDDVGRGAAGSSSRFSDNFSSSDYSDPFQAFGGSDIVFGDNKNILGKSNQKAMIS